MSTDLEYNIYKAILLNKKPTEIYVGFQSFDWFYTKVNYTATCTEAVVFTLFDKTICGLLNIESMLSLEEIGQILGFNVIDNSSERKYKDFAEYELLKDALQSLEMYEMITTGDTSYSSCQLTAIGKEYFQKGSKFKVHHNKNFQLYFDDTNHNHQKVKIMFEFLNGTTLERNDNNVELDYEDETLIKSFAESQIPEIYNVKKMNSFKDSILIDKEHKSVTLYAVFIIDAISGKYRTVVYEETSKKINDHFLDFLHKNQKFKEDLFFKVLQKFKFYPNPEKTAFSYRKELQEKEKKVTAILAADTNISTEFTTLIHQSNYIEPLMFIDSLHEIIKHSEKEVWLLFDEVSSPLLIALTKIVAEIKDKYIFIYLQKNSELSNELSDLKQQVSESINSYLILNEIEEFNVIVKNENQTSIYKKVNVPLEISQKSIKYQFIKKHIDVSIEEHIANFKSDFAGAYVKDIYDKINAVFLEKINSDLSTAKIQEIENLDFKLRPFYNMLDYEFKTNEIKTSIKSLVNATKNARKEIIDAFITNIHEELVLLNLSEERKFQTLISKIKTEKEKYEISEMDYFLTLDSKIKLKEKEFQLVKNRKSIIVDTNVLIEEPKIIDVIGKLQQIIFSAKVIDELDHLKNRKETAQKAKEAIREIRKHQKNKNIRFNTSAVDKLPDDFDKKSPDNMILSVALQYKNKNPILLTNDKSLQIKAEILEIPAKTIDELQSLLSISKRSNFNRRTNNRKKR